MRFLLLFGVLHAACARRARDRLHRMTTTIAIIETDGDHSHVQIIGPLDLSGVQAIELKLLASTASRRKPAIIDMSQVSFLASLGIGLLIQVSRALAADKHPTVVLSPAAEVEKALRMARLDALLHLADSMEAAQSHARKNTRAQ